MKLSKLIVAGAFALALGGPAFAQWPPSPPPFVTNPRLAPPAARPMAPAAQPMSRAQIRAERRAEQQRLHQARRAKAMQCRTAAAQENLVGRARRAYVVRCVAN